MFQDFKKFFKAGLYIFAFLFILLYHSISVKAELHLYGNGSRENPYEINTVQDLIYFQQEVNSGNTFIGCYVEQNCDIDFSLLREFKFSPIGNITNGTYFAGTYNGNGHYISNLVISENDDAALFGAVSGTIENLGIESGTIQSSNCAGGIAAHSVGNNALIINCYNKADIYGLTAAGIAISFDGSIINCWNIGSCITPDQHLGIIADCSSSQIMYAYSTDKVCGEEFYGQCDYADIISPNTDNKDLSLILNSNLEKCIKFRIISSEDAVFWHDDNGLCFNTDLNSYSFNNTYNGNEMGTKKSPITINTIEDLIVFRFAVDYGITYADTHFLQTNDIDAGSVMWNPIGSIPNQKVFSGYYNGGGNQIKNLKIQGAYAGFFECLGGDVYNLYIAGSEMHGEYVGGIAYMSYGHPQIYNCCVTGTLHANYSGGGIAYDFSAGRIMNCWTLIKPENNMYGICAGSADKIMDCFSNTPSVHKMDDIRQNSGQISEQEICSANFVQQLNINLITNISIPLEKVMPWKYIPDSNEVSFYDCLFPILFLCSVWINNRRKICFIILILLIGVIYLYYKNFNRTPHIKNERRNGCIDFLRILFCLCIMLLHWGQWVGDTDLYAPCGYIGVQFFFMVSGYYIAAEIAILESNHPKSMDLAKETKTVFFKKWKKIVPYFLVAAAISIIIVSIFNHPGKAQLQENLRLYIFEVLMLQMAGFPTYAIMGTEWYLSAFFLVLPLLYPIIRNHRKMYTQIIAPIVFILLMGYSAYNYGNYTSPASWTGLCFEGILRAIACLSAGCVCYEVSAFISSCKVWKKRERVILTVAELGIWFMVFYEIFTAKSFSYMDFIITLFILCGLCLTFSGVTYSKKIFSGYYTTIAAKMSIPLFLCHGYLLVFLPKYLENYNKYYSLGVFLIWALITSLADLFIVRCMKKYFKRHKKSRL